MPSEQIKTLYHYCSLDSFIKIMKSSQLRLSDIRKSNDTFEFKWVVRKCKEQLYTTFLHIGDEILQIKGKHKEGSYDPLLSDDLASILQDVEELSDSREESNSNSAWVFCFSQKRDSLDQWRGYANDGNGIAIGFNRKYLESINHSNIPPELHLECRLSPMLYNFDYKKLFGIDRININTESGAARVHSLNALNLASDLPPLFKNPSFENEEEWRIYFQTNVSQGVSYDESAIVNNREVFNGYFEIQERDFYIRQNRIVSYIPLSILRIKDAINEIVIGPKADVEEADILSILIQYGHIGIRESCPIKITRSESSYR